MSLAPEPVWTRSQCESRSFEWMGDYLTQLGKQGVITYPFRDKRLLTVNEGM
ncbi:uncharacterized protein PHALS_00692 [Plasmopara halstedii]|uniref:Uncharacterized protein n=1 Tax=Plasmopara halstedii TaxID=4781 RepID=A0A0N7L6H9_PLAHL|nr:uncharacterized protein PHALS_00692 [Plasmopara halstedii]CEG44323.1 hypothetical protein PHALS_00692 [Plasmopara halstedii]|eukprot:XP_024580692.1 hypothetical protein PHALS_00692 [Plasmopara halstedii]